MPRKKKGKIGSAFKQGSVSDRTLRDMTLKDLKKACIVRGMPFEELVASGVPELHSWFDRHYRNPQDILRLNQFDDWMELELKKKYDPEVDTWAFHPTLRMGFIGEKDEDGNVLTKKKPRLKGIDKPVKKKRERLEGTKVFKGTKKAYTYQLATRHLRKPDKKEIKPTRIIEKVIEKFPEAVDKSIKIWMKKAVREWHDNNKKK